MSPYDNIVYREEKEYVPRRCCSDTLLKKLIEAGVKTDGYERSLEDVLKHRGFGLPVQHEEYFTFMVDYRFIRYYLNYADALAHEILLLIKLKLF